MAGFPSFHTLITSLGNLPSLERIRHYRQSVMLSLIQNPRLYKRKFNISERDCVVEDGFFLCCVVLCCVVLCCVILYCVELRFVTVV